MEKNKGKIKGLLIIVLSIFLCNQDLYSQSYKEQRRIALLCELLEKEEKSGYFDEARYWEIVFSLNQYYTNNNDIHSSSELLHNAIRTVNAKSKELNTPNIRKLYLLLGRMEATLKCYNDAIVYLQVLQKLCDIAKEEDGMYMMLYQDMAMAYLGMSDLLSAKLYMDEAIEIVEKLYGSIYSIKEHEMLTVLSNYAYVSQYTGNAIEAEKCYKYIIDNSKPKSKAHQYACNNLSILLLSQGRWSEGLRYLDAVSDSNMEVKRNVTANKIYANLFLNNKKKAADCLIDYNVIIRKCLTSMFSEFSFSDLEEYWLQMGLEMIVNNNCVAFETKDKRALSDAYNTLLLCKTMNQGIYNIIKNCINESQDTIYINSFNRYNKLRDIVSHKTLTDSEQKRVMTEIIQEEKVILNSVKDMEKQMETQCGTWLQVRSMLEEDEIAIEFCYAPTKDFVNAAYDSVMYYGALVVGREFSSPIPVLLEKVDKIDSIVCKMNFNEYSINEFYNSSNSQVLYECLWEKIEPYLHGIETIYFSPAGKISQVNNSILCDQTGEYLMNKYNLVRVSATNKIAEVKDNNAESYESICLYGDIQYDMSVDDMIAASGNYDCYSGVPIDYERLRSISNRGKWGIIEGTKEEINNIEVLLGNNNIRVLKKMGTDATEESVKSISGHSPDILHFATHGYSLSTYPAADENIAISSMTPFSRKEGYLLWSGLLMAGANNAWSGNKTNINVEDGILTADEVSRLDLSGTRLAVLSACETANGILDPIDGILGLQHAFKKAGVKTIVMSLWKIPDEATSMLMRYFYSFLMDGLECNDALKRAMREMKSIYADPYYWGSFIILN